MAQERTDLPGPLVPGQGPHLLASQVPLTLPVPFPAPQARSRSWRVLPVQGRERPPFLGPGQSELQQEGSRLDLHL